MAKPGLGSRHQAIARIIRKQVEQGRPCWWCGEAIDLDLPARHPLSFSVDHVVERRAGGESTLANSAPAHYGRCNSARSNRKRRRPGQPLAGAWRPRRW